MFEKLLKFFLLKFINYNLIPINILIFLSNNYLGNKIVLIYISNKIILDLNKFKSHYWFKKESILYYIHNNQILFGKGHQDKVISSLISITKQIPNSSNYLEIGCGYPMYLKNKILKKKIKNYYGYDINPYIKEFFKINKVYNKMPKNYKADVILLLSGVLKYYNKNEILEFFKYISKNKPKIIIVSHPKDEKIILYNLKNIKKIHFKRASLSFLKDKINLVKVNF